MRPHEIGEMAAFLAVARHLNFRRAAIERGVAPSAISHSLRNLEERIGVRLVQRTTRSVALTEAGARYAEDLQIAFTGLSVAQDRLNEFRDTPFSTVRINVPSSIAPFLLRNMMGRLTQQNPGLCLDIVATDKLVDIVKEGFDLGVRFGEVLSNDMIAVRIQMTERLAVVGSPKYFGTRPVPKHPRDLQNHVCIRRRHASGKIFNWRFWRGGETVEVEVNGQVTLDSQELMVEAALQDCGLAYVWADRASYYMERGSLVGCLGDWSLSSHDLFIYYPSRDNITNGARAVIDFLRI